MARPNLPDFKGPYPQYYSLVTKEDDTVLGQIRSIELEDSIDSEKAGRVGSSRKKTLRKSKETSGTVNVWTDLDLVEVAAFLGSASTPVSGDTVKLDPTVTEQTFKIKTYDGEDASATLKSTIYLFNMVPTSLSISYDEDGEQVAQIQTEMEDLYWIVA